MWATATLRKTENDALVRNAAARASERSPPACLAWAWTVPRR